MKNRRNIFLILILFFASTVCCCLFFFYTDLWYSDIPEAVVVLAGLLDDPVNKFLFLAGMLLIPAFFIAEIILLVVKKISSLQFVLLLFGPPACAYLIAHFILPLLLFGFQDH